MKTAFARFTRSGFTLLELMLVIAVITLLIGLLFAGIQAAMRSRRTAQALTTIKSIETASRAYATVYGWWPSATGVSITNSGSHFVNCMRGNLTVIAGNTATITNPRGQVFLDFKPSDLLGPANFQSMTDPYGSFGPVSGMVYYIYYDHNGDNYISIADLGAPAGFPASGSISSQITIWSGGPNRLNNWGTLDDHKSW